MLRPSMYEIIGKNDSYYAFVVAVAARAREITDDAERNHEHLIEKPVDIAVNDLAQRKVKVEDYV